MTMRCTLFSHRKSNAQKVQGKTALLALAAVASASLVTGCTMTDDASAQSSNRTERDPLARTLAAIANLDERGQRIAKPYLEGREPGAPVQCISSNRIRRSTTASDNVMIYEESGGVVYVNTPYGGCNGARDNAMVTQRPTLRMCAGDIVLVQDLIARVPVGSCAFSEFIPYTKRKETAER